MRLPAVMIGLVLAGGCTRRDDPPDEGDRPGWRVQAVPECGFSVELPGPATRDDTPVGGVPKVLYVHDDGNRQRFMIECIPLPAAMPTPAFADALRELLARRTIELAGMPRPVIDIRSAIESGDTARWVFDYGEGITIEGRFALVGRQLHDVSGAGGPTPGSRATLDRVLGSYRRQ